MHPLSLLSHWGRVTHICVGNLTIIGPDNGLSPGRRQAIIWTNAGILLNGPWGTKFNEILIGIHTFHSRKFIWKCLRNGAHFVSASICQAATLKLVHSLFLRCFGLICCGYSIHSLWVLKSHISISVVTTFATKCALFLTYGCCAQISTMQ